MYYLFVKKQTDLENYRKDFDRVAESIQKGKTPVFNELRSAKTNLAESFPYNFLCGVFLILGTILLNKIKINEVVKIALVLIVNSFCGAISNYIFTENRQERCHLLRWLMNCRKIVDKNL